MTINLNLNRKRKNMSGPDEKKGVYQILTVGGMDEDIAQRASRVATALSNHGPQSPSGLDGILKAAFPGDFTGADLTGSLMILAEHRLVAFDSQSGKYGLTPQGESCYR